MTSAEPSGKISILVMDDVHAVRVQIKELLKSCGLENVKTVANGAEAQTLLMTNEYQMVIADWQTTPVDGMELLGFIRGQEKLKSLAFFMLTAESTKLKVLEATEAGIDGYIVKPLTADTIRTKIYTVLLKKQVM